MIITIIKETNKIILWLLDIKKLYKKMQAYFQLIIFTKNIGSIYF